MKVFKKSVYLYILLFLCVGVSEANAQVTVSEFPVRYKLNGNDVIMITPLQVKRINRVFLDAENSNRKVLSLTKEVSLLNEMLLKRDSVVVYKDVIIETVNEKEKIYVEQLRIADTRYEAVVKAKNEEIKKVKRNVWKVGGITLGVGFAVGALIGIF